MCTFPNLHASGENTHTHTHYLQTFELLVNGLQGSGSACLIIIGVFPWSVSQSREQKQREVRTQPIQTLNIPKCLIQTIFPTFPPRARNSGVTVQGHENLWVLYNSLTSDYDSETWWPPLTIFPDLTCCISTLDPARTTHRSMRGLESH